MGRFLPIDIGAGTMDILCYDSETNLSYNAVAESPTLYLAKKIECMKKDLYERSIQYDKGCALPGSLIHIG